MIALLTAILELLPFARRRTRGVSVSVVSMGLVVSVLVGRLCVSCRSDCFVLVHHFQPGVQDDYYCYLISVMAITTAAARVTQLDSIIGDTSNITWSNFYKYVCSLIYIFFTYVGFLNTPLHTGDLCFMPSLASFKVP